MTTKRRVWLGLGAAAAIGLGAIATTPSTSWIVRQEAHSIGEMLRPNGNMPMLLGDRTPGRRAGAARAFPDDVAMQVGAAGTDVDALEALHPRYANSPALQSEILLALATRRMDLKGRDTDAALLSPADTAKSVRNGDAVTPETQELWENAAATGERLDPDNAFFPFMHAVGLFAAHHDDAAVAEIDRASRMPRYDEHLREVTEGRWRLADAANGMESGAIPKEAIAASTLLPHYALLRGAARLAAVRAVTLEQAGQTEDGFAIRQSLERIGARMRTDSPWLIGNLVGEAIGGIAGVRPGGAPAIHVDSSMSGNQRTAAAAARYENYLRQIGHPEEVAVVEHDIAARSAVKQISERGMSLELYSIVTIVRVVARWTVSAAVLGNLLLILFLGGLCRLICRTRTVRDGLPLRKSAALLIGSIGLCAGLYLMAGMCRTFGQYTNTAATLNMDGSEATNAAAARMMAGLLLTTIAILVPVGMATVFFVRSRRRRMPAFTGLVRGFASSALPTAILLACLYIGMVVDLSAQEARLLEQQRLTIVHEGRQMARLTGQTWPSFGPEEGTR